MTATSIGRIVVPALALVAACGTAIVFSVTHVWREPPLETIAATVMPAVSAPALATRDESSATFATAKTEANALAAELAGSPPSPVTDGSMPAFDVARIEPSGDAVIAGRAAPGAIVELLRGGERHDQAVADQSGLFVMVPPRLPAGNYELTLRARMPDGTLATSSHGVVVALNDVQSTGALQSHAEATSNVQAPTVANRLRQEVAISQPRAAAAIASPNGGSASAAVEPRMVTRVVSRGDSLWHISRVTYGDGTRYAVVYKANRERIRDPNRIYPGQIFVLPMKPR